MMTFSIYDGTDKQTISYLLNGDLSNGSSFDFLLSKLPNNEAGEINPIDIRNSILSTWSSSIFKLTTTDNSNVPYIGIDTLNPHDNDLKKKILIGKKDYQSNDIINGLTDSNYDILFYNTKLDTRQQITTRLSLLSGRDNFINAPFIQSQDIFGTSSVSFDFIAGGDISLLSIDPYEFKSNLSLNTFKTPNGATSNGVVIWSDSDDSMVINKLTITSTASSFGTSSNPLNIFGRVNINDYDLEFKDDRFSPIEIGDIKFGHTFDNFSISDILSRVVYKYLPPTSRIKILQPYQNNLAEIGTIPSVTLEFTILRNTNNTNVATLLNMTPGTFPAIISNDYTSITATASGLITAPLNQSGVTFSVTVGDGEETTTTSTNISGIYPYFYGFFQQTNINSSNLSQLTKLIEGRSDKSITINPGSGTFFFIYDSSYGHLDEILDSNNNTVGLTYSLQNFSSPDGYWANKEFKVYRIDNLTVNNALIYKFKY